MPDYRDRDATSPALLRQKLQALSLNRAAKADIGSGGPLSLLGKDGEQDSLTDLNANAWSYGVASPIKSIGQRIFGDSEGADTTNRINQAVQSAAASRDDEIPYLHPRVTQAVRGAAQQAPLALGLGMAGGLPPMVAGFSAMAYDQAKTEAKDAGLSEADSEAFARKAAIVEGAITTGFQAVGLGGTEKIITEIGKSEAKRTVKQHVADRIKSALKDLPAELLEENAIELTTNAIRAADGVDSKAADFENQLNTVIDTSLQTTAMQAGIKGFHKAVEFAAGEPKRTLQDDQTPEPAPASLSGKRDGLQEIPETVVTADPTGPTPFPTGSLDEGTASIRDRLRESGGMAFEDLADLYDSESSAAIDEVIQVMMDEGQVKVVDGKLVLSPEAASVEPTPAPPVDDTASAESTQEPDSGTLPEPVADGDTTAPPAGSVEEKPVNSFETSQGSTYTFDGTSSTRNKTPHIGHDPDDRGLKKPSEITYFVDPEGGRRLGMHGTLVDAKIRVIVRNGFAYPVAWIDKAGKWGISPDDRKNPVKLSTSPSIGLSPLELWQGQDSSQMSGGKEYANWHPGSPITKINGKSPDLVPVVPAADGADRVAEAYAKLGKNRSGTRVRLADLRKELSDIHREELDAILQGMVKSGDIVLNRLDNPNEITAADEEAKLTTGLGDPRHIMAMDIRQASETPSKTKPASEVPKTFIDDFNAAWDKVNARSDTPASIPKIVDLRKELSQYTPAEFNAGVRVARQNHGYFADSLSGGFIQTTQEERDGGIQEGTSLLGYLGRKSTFQGPSKTEPVPTSPTIDGSKPPEDAIADFFKNGGSYKNINDARKDVEQFTGKSVKPGTPEAKEVDEIVERGVVGAARSIIRRNIAQDGTPDVDKTFDEMVGLYNRQPNLSVRDSNSLREQAYSTPAPLAYLGTVLADIHPTDAAYDSSAGNGMLLIGSDNPSANEINKRRSEWLKSQGIPTTTEDATSYQDSGQYPRIAINPPFGADPDDKTKRFTVDGEQYSQMDHAIALNSLKSLAGNGKAVIIVGAKGKGDSQRERGKAYRNQRKFYDQLYDNYNVTDHFTVSGDLYSRQGASFPVDMIVVDGKGKSSRKKPYNFLDGGLPQKFNTWSELKDAKLKPAIAGYQSRGSGRVGDGSRGPSVGAGTGTGSTSEGGRSGNDLGNVPGTNEATSGVGSEQGTSAAADLPAGVDGQNRPGSVPDKTSRGPRRKPSVPGDAGEQGDTPGGLSQGDRSDGGRGQGQGGTDQPQVGPSLDAAGDDLTQQDIDDFMGKLFDQAEGKTPPPKSGPKGKGRGKSQGGKRKPGKTKIQTKAEEKKAAEDKAYEDLFKKARETLGPKGKLSSGLDPELGMLAVKAAIASVESKAYSFAAYVERVYNGVPDLIDDLAPYLESAWRHAINRNPKLPLTPVGRVADVVADLQSAVAEIAPQVRDNPSEFQSVYTSTSKAKSVGSLIPKNQVDAFHRRLGFINDTYGDIDTFVATELGFTLDRTLDKFSSEQIEAVGLAIAAHNDGVSLVLGDQTGLGKGRVVAGIMEFAKQRGYTPVFVTGKLGLMTDMMRDLTDIGVNADGNLFTPYITNDVSGKDAINLHALAGGMSDRIVSHDSKTSREIGKSIVASIKAGNGLVAKTGKGKNETTQKYDAIFTTYSQLQPNKGETWRHDMFRKIAPNAFFIFDESHNAGGGKGGWVSPTNDDGTPRAPTSAEFSRDLAATSKGNLFSSATFAKNPSVMTLYATTGISKAVGNIKDLPEIMASGGIPLQQAVSGQMASAGVYARRERSYEGIEFKTKEVEVDLSKVDEATRILAEIKRFDDLKNEALVNLTDRIISDGGYIAADPSVGAVAVDSITFSSISHTLVDQLLMSAKAEATADEAIAAMGRGEKPVIVVEMTNESALKDYLAIENEANAGGERGVIKVGDEIQFDFNVLLQRYLRRSRQITIKPDKKNKATWITRQLTDEELGAVANVYYDVQQQIGVLDVPFPASPIDAIRNRITAAGKSVAEITGRSQTVQYLNGRMFLAERNPDEMGNRGKTLSAKGFNDGTIDALIINRSGAEGISLHANSTFKDTRPRHMIIAQAAKNIDEFMQALGRVHRTGQVNKPTYTMLNSNVPAESRPASVVTKKLSSLNASVTASSSGDVQFDVPDIMNVVGNEAVRDYLEDNPDLARRLDVDVPERSIPEGYARTVSGRVSLLPTALQRDFWDNVVRMFNEQIVELDAANANPLSAKVLDMDAKVQERFEMVPGVPGSRSPFEAPAYLERVDAKVTTKPMTTEEINDAIDDHLDGDNPDQWYAKMFTSLRDDMVRFTRDMKPDSPQRSAALSRLEQMQSRMKSFKPGAVVYVQTGEEGSRSQDTGIVLGWTRGGKTKDPTSFSDFTLEVVTGEDGRKAKIKASKIGRSVTIESRVTEFDDALAEIAALSAEARENRFIATGNILAAFDKLQGKGKIVFYTDSDGATQQGVLMPKAFDAEKWQAARPVLFRNPAEAKAFLNAGGALTSADFVIHAILKNGQLKLTAPKSVQRGGKYTKSKAIMNASGTVFVTSGADSVMNVDQAHMQDVLQAVIDIAPLQAGTEAMKAEARKYSTTVSRKITEDEFQSERESRETQGEITPREQAKREMRKEGDTKAGIAAQDIIKTMSRQFGITFTIRKLRKGVGGTYTGLDDKGNNVPQFIALAEAAALDVGTMMHEVAHHIDRLFAVAYPNREHSSPQMPARFMAQIRSLDYEPGKARLEEGFAEYVRMWLMEDSIRGQNGEWVSGVRSRAPEFTTWLEDVWLKDPAHKAIADALMDTKQYVRKYQDQSIFQTLRTMVGTNAGEDLSSSARTRRWLRNGFFKFRRSMDDRYVDAQFIDQSAEANGPNDLKFRDVISRYDQVEIAEASRALENGVHDISTLERLEDEGFWTTAQDNLKNDVEIEEFEVYALAKHLLWFSGRNPSYKGPMSLGDAQKMVDHVSKDKDKLSRYDTVAKKISDTAHALLEMRVRSGSLSPGDAKRIINSMGDNYFPMFRATGNEMIIGRGGVGKFVNVNNSVSRRTKSGSQRPVISPFESMQKMAIDYYRIAGKARVNEALRQKIDPAFGGSEGLGFIGRRIAATNKPTDQDVIPVMEELVKLGIIEDEQFRALLTANKVTGKILGKITEADLQNYIDYHDIKINEALDPDDISHSLLLHMLKQGDLNQIIRTWKPVYESKPGKLTAISYTRSGQPLVYEYDKEIYNMLMGLDEGHANETIEFIRVGSRAFKSAVVSANVTFAMANLVRDYIGYQGRAHHVKGIRTFTAPLRHFKEYSKYKGRRSKVGANSLYIAYDEGGGSSFSRVGLDSSSRKRAVKQYLGKTRMSRLGIDLASPKTYLRGAASSVAAAREFLEGWVSLTDAPARLAEFEASIASEGYTPLKDGKWLFQLGGTKQEVNSLPEATLIRGMRAAADATVDFKQSGTLSKSIDAFVPFFVASINANKRFGKEMLNLRHFMETDANGEYTERGSRANRYFSYTAAMATMAAIYYAMRRDDEDYKESEGWLLNRYWTFGMNGTTYVRVPKPQDEAIISNLVESLMGFAFQDVDTRTVQDVFSYDLANRISMGGGPIAAAGEVAMNYDTFRERPIEPEYLRDRYPQYQYDDSVTSTSVVLGKLSGKVNISPAQLEHLANGVTGGLYEKVIKTVEDGTNGSWSVESIPGVRAFAMSRHEARSIGDVYDRGKELKAKIDAKTRQIEASGGNNPEWEKQTTEELESARDEAANLEGYRDLISEFSGISRQMEGPKYQLNPYMVGLAREALGKEPLESSINPFEVASLDDLPEPIREPMREHVLRMAKVAVLRQGYPQQDEYKDGSTFEEHLAKWKANVVASQKWLQEHSQSELVQEVISSQRKTNSFKRLREAPRPVFREGKESLNAYSKRVKEWSTKRASTVSQ